ncbi:hypothetical protein FRC12_009451 [Ceratobasidium sp. 428]|nr:hypothetical protein FRC12_009451 [Ceratobasidium sp. 428]
MSLFAVDSTKPNCFDAPVVAENFSSAPDFGESDSKSGRDGLERSTPQALLESNPCASSSIGSTSTLSLALSSLPSFVLFSTSYFVVLFPAHLVRQEYLPYFKLKSIGAASEATHQDLKT